MRGPRRVRTFALCCALAAALSACVTVKPQDKELLADPAMIYGSGGKATRQEQHVLENREGATSGSASGGGCGCN
ncbi:MAG: hypothetical protein JWN48_4446 [Myxococcaceae bacterium]|nr:hypothetical protein [Myxococcaceae bacterium]